LRGDHTVGSRRHVAFRFQVITNSSNATIKPPQICRPTKKVQRSVVRARELGQLHKIFPPKDYGGVLRFCFALETTCEASHREVHDFVNMGSHPGVWLAWRGAYRNHLLASGTSCELNSGSKTTARSYRRLIRTSYWFWGAAYLGLALGAKPMGAGGARDCCGDAHRLSCRPPPRCPSRAVREAVDQGSVRPKGLARKAIATGLQHTRALDALFRGRP